MHIYVRLDDPVDGFPPFRAEEIDAEELGGQLYRVCGIPAFANGIARGDVVRGYAAQDGRVWASERVSPGGHWTARVVLFSKRVPDLDAGYAEFATSLAAMGCDSYRTHGMLVIDIPPDAPAVAVVKLLEDGFLAGRLDFDLPEVPDGVVLRT